MHWRRRADEIVSLVNLHVEWDGNVMTHPLETRLIEHMGDVLSSAGEEIVYAQNFMTPRE